MIDYEILGQFLLAALWGGIVGSEREYRSKSAGFRTMIMISIGACFFTMMSVKIGGLGNPDRIASSIVSGVGFLGAGVIFRGENRVNGITTAASIWSVAAVGMGIGGGYYFAATCASILILIVLAILPYVEQTIDRINQAKTYRISCTYSNEHLLHFEQLLQQHKLHYKLTSQVKDGNLLVSTWQTQGAEKNHTAFINAVLQDDAIARFEY